MARPSPNGYSTAQVTLHWLVVLLIIFQFLAHDGMEAAWRAFERGQPTPADSQTFAYLHVAAGILVLLFAAARLFLRFTRGAPKLPPQQPAALKGIAHGVHWGIYLLLFLLPISGSVAWFGGVAQAAEGHELMKNILLVLVGLHVAGALFEHFVLKTPVLMRMMRPENS